MLNLRKKIMPFPPSFPFQFEVIGAFPRETILALLRMCQGDLIRSRSQIHTSLGDRTPMLLPLPDSLPHGSDV